MDAAQASSSWDVERLLILGGVDPIPGVFVLDDTDDSQEPFRRALKLSFSTTKSGWKARR